MVEVPVAPPVTVPSVPIPATDVFVLLHVPPVVASESNVVKPWHTLSAPEIAAGCVFTVTTALMAHMPSVYDMVTVPVFMPVTTPPALMAATVGVTLLHTPPAVASVSVMENVWHTGILPPMATGWVSTVTACVT